MSRSDEITRCRHCVNVISDCVKQCIRNDGHTESHAWIEAETRSDGLPMLVQWDNTGVRHFEYKRVPLSLTGIINKTPSVNDLKGE